MFKNWRLSGAGIGGKIRWGVGSASGGIEAREGAGAGGTLGADGGGRV